MKHVRVRTRTAANWGEPEIVPLSLYSGMTFYYHSAADVLRRHEDIDVVRLEFADGSEAEVTRPERTY